MRQTYQPAYRLRRRNRLSLLAYRLRGPRLLLANLADVIRGSLKDARIADRGAVGRVVDQHRFAADEPHGAATGKRWCLYAAYSPTSAVSEMVLEQLRTYAEAGFSVVFITMSRKVADVDLDRLCAVCSHVIHRRSFGRDFGAWVDGIRLLGDEVRQAEALMLTNDSLLGPVYPLEPWLERFQAKAGIFGFTESLQGGSHLQSYFLVANGSAAVGSMISFLRSVKLSHSKWLMVQRGEIAFTQAMRASGHPTFAAFDHETVENAFLGDAVAQAELAVVNPGVFGDAETWASRANGADSLDHERTRHKVMQRYRLRGRLFVYPLNPTHQLASFLVSKLGFPFVKVEFVIKNPGMLPSAPDWRYLLTKDSPVSESMLDEHLATLG